MTDIIVTTKSELRAIIEQSIKDILKPLFIPPLKHEGLFTTEEAAEYLKIPLASVYQLTHKRELSYSKAGRSNRFYKKDLDAYLAANRKANRNENINKLNNTHL